MRDAETATHAIEGLRSSVLETLLGFVYEGSCQVEEGLLTEMLDASARLVVDPLKAACARAIQSQLAPCNALDVWRLADLYTLPALEKAAVDSALRGFEELPLQSASGAQVRDRSAAQGAAQRARTGSTRNLNGAASARSRGNQRVRSAPRGGGMRRGGGRRR